MDQEKVRTVEELDAEWKKEIEAYVADKLKQQEEADRIRNYGVAWTKDKENYILKRFLNTHRSEIGGIIYKIRSKLMNEDDVDTLALWSCLRLFGALSASLAVEDSIYTDLDYTELKNITRNMKYILVIKYDRDERADWIFFHDRAADHKMSAVILRLSDLVYLYENVLDHKEPNETSEILRSKMITVIYQPAGSNKSPEEIVTKYIQTGEIPQCKEGYLKDKVGEET